MFYHKSLFDLVFFHQSLLDLSVLSHTYNIYVLLRVLKEKLEKKEDIYDLVVF